MIVKLSSTLFRCKVMLCYRKNSWAIEDFYYLVCSLSISYKPDIILGDFNVKPNVELCNLLGNYTQLVSQATHVAGSNLDHVYIQNELLDDYYVNVNINYIFFSDHEMIEIIIQAK